MHCDVSVIMPCFNSKDTIERSIISICEQTYPPLEILIIDDKSDDSYEKIIDNLKEKLIEKNISLEITSNSYNIGPGSSRNIGIKKARARYIAFLDSDDAWDIHKLERQFMYMELNPDVQISSHSLIKCKTNSSIRAKVNMFNSRNISRYEILLHNPILMSSVMIRNSGVVQFPENSRYAEDYWCWATLLFDGVKFSLIKEDLLIMYKSLYSGVGLSSNLKSMHLGVIYVLRHLHATQKISIYLYLCSVGVEKLKFIKRILMVTLRKMLK